MKTPKKKSSLSIKLKAARKKHPRSSEDDFVLVKGKFKYKPDKSTGLKKAKKVAKKMKKIAKVEKVKSKVRRAVGKASLKLKGKMSRDNKITNKLVSEGKIKAKYLETHKKKTKKKK